MSVNPETPYIQECLLLIEKKLAWGDSQKWSHFDFEKLSDLIHENTSVRVSVTTLKRIWGRVKYENIPTIATLNTLARFAGLDDWRTFRLQALESWEEKTTPVSSSPKSGFNPKWWYWILSLIVGTVTTYFIIGTIRSNNKPDPKNFSFKANKVVGEGVPNSVVFEYNARAAKTDSVFIAQSWDTSRKTLVPKTGQNHSAIYYFPGYYEAKLIVDGKIVQKQDLQITSNGWLGLVESNDKPFYLSKKDITRPWGVEIDTALLVRNHFKLKPELPWLSFFNQSDLGDLMNDNFVFETTLKNDFNEGSNPCQFVEVLIQCKNDIIFVPLSALTCVGELNLYAAGQQVNSKTSDLSGFGANLSEWTTLKVEAKNKQMRFYVNGKEALSLTFPNKPAGIVGVHHRFRGAGAVKNTWFENSSGRRNL